MLISFFRIYIILHFAIRESALVHRSDELFEMRDQKLSKATCVGHLSQYNTYLVNCQPVNKVDIYDNATVRELIHIS